MARTIILQCLICFDENTSSALQKLHLQTFYLPDEVLKKNAQISLCFKDRLKHYLLNFSAFIYPHEYKWLLNILDRNE